MTDISNEDENFQRFDFCDKVDLHALEPKINLQSIVAVATEHGFRGIVVNPCDLSNLNDELGKIPVEIRTVLPITIIDYPFGMMSLDARAYSIQSAKEKGAKEVEIVAPYPLLVRKDFKAILADLQNICNIAKKCDINLKYVLDLNNKEYDDSVIAKMCRIFMSSKINIVSTSLGYFDKNQSNTDLILKMRSIKNKVGCNIKSYISSNDPNDLLSFIKAGSDIIGLKWNKAPFLVHEYEDLVQKPIS